MPAKNIYVYSKLANSQNFHIFVPGGAEVPRIYRTITIQGNSGIADPRTLITSMGRRTEISEEDLAAIEQMPSFQRWIKAGYLCVQKRLRPPPVESVISDMTGDTDPSSPLTDADFRTGDGRKTPKIYQG